MGNSQVSGSLSTPVAIAPQLPLIPYVPAEPYHRCVDRSWDPEWVVEQFSFRHHASQGLDGVAGKKFYELSLNLTNASNGETVPCSVTVDEQTSATARGTWPWVKCAAPANATSLISQTEVMLDPDYGVLGVQQTWNCTDGIAGIDACVRPPLGKKDMTDSAQGEIHRDGLPLVFASLHHPAYHKPVRHQGQPRRFHDRLQLQPRDSNA